jgi:nucleolar protein 58
LREFQTFEDKASAIKLDTGVSDQLARMIKKWLLPKQKIAVGKLEYKTCIEASLKIPCLFDDAVMELMWGLKNMMKSLVPEEKLELTKQDRLPMSK